MKDILVVVVMIVGIIALLKLIPLIMRLGIIGVGKVIESGRARKPREKMPEEFKELSGKFFVRQGGDNEFFGNFVRIENVRLEEAGWPIAEPVWNFDIRYLYIIDTESKHDLRMELDSKNRLNAEMPHHIFERLKMYYREATSEENKKLENAVKIKTEEADLRAKSELNDALEVEKEADEAFVEVESRKKTNLENKTKDILKDL